MSVVKLLVIVSALLVSSPLQAQTLKLVDASTNIIVNSKPSVINLTDFPSFSAELVASTKRLSQIEKVDFYLNKQSIRSVTTAPYTLFVKNGNDYTGQNLTAGTHIVEAHIFTKGKTKATKRRLRLTVVAGPATVHLNSSAISLAIINPSSNQIVKTITNAGTINLSQFQDNKVAFVLQVGTTAEKLTTVEFVLKKPDGTDVKKRVAKAPYSVFGGKKYVFSGSSLAQGSYTLSYTAKIKSSKNKKTGQFTFNLTNGTTPPSSPNPIPTTPHIPEVPAGNVRFQDWPSGSPAIVSDLNTTVGIPVHVNAIQSNSPLFVQGSNTQRHLIEYKWDIGDSNAPHRYFKGFNVAHHYDTPGTYYITLYAKNRTNSATTFKAVRINVSDSQRTAIYVSSSGNDSSSGLNPNNAVKTIKRAMNIVASRTNQQNRGFTVHLNKGDRFSIQEPINFTTNNTVLTSYGSGAQPQIIRANRSLGIFTTFKDNLNNIVIRDIYFSSNEESNPDKSGGARILNHNNTIKNVALIGCTLRSVSDAVNLEFRPSQTLVKDNIAPNPFSIRSYLVWGNGSDVVIVGNHAVNSTREHIYRQGGVERVLLAYNSFANVKGDSGDIGKSVFNVQSGDSVYIYGNTSNEGPSGVGPLGGNDGTKGPNQKSTYTVFDSNLFLNGDLYVNPNAHYIRVVNNIIHTGRLQVSSRDFTGCRNPSNFPNSGCAYPNRDLKDIIIENNTSYSSNTNYRCFNVGTAVLPRVIRYTNNLCVAPNLETGHYAAAGVYIDGPNLNTFSEFSGNILPIPKKFAWIPDAYHVISSLGGTSQGYVSDTEFINRCQREVSSCSGNQHRNVSLDSNLNPTGGVTIGARR